MGTSRVVIPGLPALSYDAGGGPEHKGAVVFTSIDIISYPTSGETVRAAELGLSKIFSLILQRNENGGTANGHIVEAVIAAGGASAVLWSRMDDGTSGIPAQSTNTTDLGTYHVMASGEGALSGVENLTV
jgi:hypothetical protein